MLLVSPLLNQLITLAFTSESSVTTGHARATNQLSHISQSCLCIVHRRNPAILFKKTVVSVATNRLNQRSFQFSTPHHVAAVPSVGVRTFPRPHPFFLDFH